MKILIIEDETEIAAGIRNYFKPNGFCCETAKNFGEATAKLNCMITSTWLSHTSKREQNTEIVQ